MERRRLMRKKKIGRINGRCKKGIKGKEVKMKR
jgi:hypothetical protein